MTIPLKKFGSYYSGKILGHRVYAKLKWRDQWELKQHVMCESATWAAAPSMGSATLYYRYGPGVFPGVEPGNWLNKFDLPTLAFVRIDFDVVDLPDDADLPAQPILTTRSWYGIVGTLVEAFAGSDVEKNAGADPLGNIKVNRVLQGKQTLNAVGLEWLLDRQYVTRSWYIPELGGQPAEAKRGWNFNQYGIAQAANRSSEKFESPAGTNTYVFNYSSTSKFWTTRDIVEYLLSWHMGRNQSGLVNMPWKSYYFLPIIRDDQFEIPSLGDVHGITVRQLLNQLIARQRGYSYRVEVYNDTLTDSQNAEVWIEPFTTTAEDIILPQPPDADDAEVIKIPANENLVQVDMTNDRTCSPIVVTKDAFSEYDQIEVYGARAVHCVTLDFAYFSRNWEQDNEVNYDGGGSSEAGFPVSAEVADRQRWIAEYRSRSQFENVYRRFFVEPAMQTPGGKPVWPDFDDPIANPTDANREIPTEEMPIWDRVPMISGVDYSSRATFKNTLPTDWRERPLLAPSVYFEIDSKWYSGEKISVSQDVEAPTETDNFHFAVKVTPLPERPGNFYLDVFGQPQHVIADGIFTPLPDDKAVGGVSYEDAEITLAILGDYHAVARWPDKLDQEIDYDPDATLRVRTINAGDQYQFHLVLDGTIFGISNGQLQRTSQAIIVRDDRPRLKEIARMAYMWYGKPRRALQFSTQLVSNALEVGDMITAMVVDRDGGMYQSGPDASEEINTCVTSITIRNQVGGEAQPVPVIEYKTEFSELDVISYFT